MNTPVLSERTATASPRPAPRITGVVYLLYFLTASIRRVVHSRDYCIW